MGWQCARRPDEIAWRVLLIILVVGLVVPRSAAPARVRRGAAPRQAKPLDIYVVDTEGGKAALFVRRPGQSLLIDSGNPGGRDTDRHHGGGQRSRAQADRLPDHDALPRRSHRRHGGAGQADPGRHVHRSRAVGRRARAGAGVPGRYAELYGKAKHLVVKPGDKVPIAGLDWRIVTAGGQRAEDAAARRRQAESGLRRRSRRRRSPPIPRTRSRSAAWSRSDSSARRLRRPALEQGARADVPEQPDRDRRPVLGLPSRARPVQLAGAGARRCSRASR